MTKLLEERETPVRRPHRRPPVHRARRRLRHANWPAGVASLFWLVLVGLPLYVLVGATFRSEDNYLEDGPLTLPWDATFENYGDALSGDFPTYLWNTVLVTFGTVAIVLGLGIGVGYAIVRSGTWLSRAVFRTFLLGLAIPAQAVIVPVYLILSKMQMYDSLMGIVLPTAAFSMPVCVLVLVTAMRDIDEELYESMALDGAGQTRILGQLVLPMSKAGMSAAGIYAALQAWNGLLFPLILTTSPENKVLTTGLYDYVEEFGLNVPGLLTAVLLSMLPIFVVYLFARRLLVSGLMGVGGK